MNLTIVYFIRLVDCDTAVIIVTACICEIDALIQKSSYTV